MWPFWLLVSGIFFIIEIYTVGFFIFWFGIGALLAMIVSFFTSNLIIQSAVFLISSTILLILTKPLVKKFIKNIDKTPTNVYSIIGKEGIVLEDIKSVEASGKIKVKGELWSAFADEDIPKDSKIKVISISGVKAKVEKI